MSNKITQINHETGEILDGVLVYVPKKRKSPFERHFTMNQDALKILAKELNHEQFKVLMMLLADLDYENYIQITQQDIADSLGMKKSNVSRAVKGLINLRIVLEGPKVGRSKTYRLNEQFGWKGSVPNHKKALKNGLSVINGGRA
ncbi:MarR family transcriptional regulator [Escherichia coli]|nr:MarR family transcriptional regulator [Escherichia coli]